MASQPCQRLAYAFGVVPLVLIEGIGRLFLPFPLGVRGTYEASKKLIYFHRPKSVGYEVSDFNEFDPVKVVYNEFGFRSNLAFAENGKENIFIVGDSFVESRQIEENKTFIELLQRQTDKFNIINAGCSAFTSTTEFLLIKNKILDLNPKKIFLFFTFNDYSDNFKYQGGYFKQLDIFDNDPQDNFLPEDYRESKLVGVVDQIKRRSSWFSYFHWLLQKQPSTPVKKQNDISFAKDFMAVNVSSTEFSSLDKEILDFTHQGLSKIKEILEQKKIEFKVFIIPLPLQVNAREWAKGKHVYYGYPEDKVDENTYYQERILKFCQTKGISCIDLLPEFKKKSIQGPIFFNVDGHWTEFGQQVVSDILKNYLD